MASQRTPPSGRPPALRREQVVAAAVEVGLRHLTLQAVASRLGVSIPGLYRYVADRDHLEALVGDSLAAHFAEPPDRGQDAATYLIEIGHGIRALTLAHDGLGDHLNRLGTHSPNWLGLIERCDRGLVRRGMHEADAVALGSAVANFAIASVERQRQAEIHASDDRLYGSYYDAVTAEASQLPVLQRGQEDLLGTSPDDYFAWTLDCYVHGLIDRLAEAPWARSQQS